jgi:hypothetical protein
MKILLVDTQKHCRVTFEETKRILTSGLTPNQWTQINIFALLNLKRSA